VSKSLSLPCFFHTPYVLPFPFQDPWPSLKLSGLSSWQKGYLIPPSLPKACRARTPPFSLPLAPNPATVVLRRSPLFVARAITFFPLYLGNLLRRLHHALYVPDAFLFPFLVPYFFLSNLAFSESPLYPKPPPHILLRSPFSFCRTASPVGLDVASSYQKF